MGDCSGLGARAAVTISPAAVAPRMAWAIAPLVTPVGAGAAAGAGAQKPARAGETARRVGVPLEAAEDGLERPVVARAALKRLAEPEDVAAMTAFLMGEGGRNVTGAVMTVDAGGSA